MKHPIFLLVSFSCCFASFAHAAKPVRSAPGKGHPVVRVFQNAHAPGFCMGVAGGSTTPRALVKQGRCALPGDNVNVQPDQFWILEPIGKTIYYHIRNGKNRRMCLGVERGSRARRANIRQGVCNNNADQRWSFPSPPGRPNDDPARVNIRNAHGLCIGVERASTTRAQLKQNRCSGASDQTWYIWFVGDGPVG